MKSRRFRLVPVTLLTLGLASLTESRLPALAPEDTAETFLLYESGIEIGELIVASSSDSEASPTWTLLRRDRFTREWSEPSVALETEVAASEPLRLPGSLGELSERLMRLRRIEWSSLEAVGLPDAEHIYVRQRRLHETISGENVVADYWAERDASRPLDLILGAEGRLLAAVDPSADLVLVRSGLEGFTTHKRWREPGVSQPLYGVRSAKKSMVAMRDGTRLATLVYLPDELEEKGAEGKTFSTILVRTPYGLTDLIDRYWHHVARGYAVVLQSTRGRAYWDPEYRSEGDWELVIHEPSDGADTLEWITKQPWSNGRIGMQGGSYVGYTQWAATMADNPALRCIVPESSMGTVFSDQPFMGGGFVAGLAYYMFWMLDAGVLPGRTWEQILRHRPLIEIDSFATGRDLPQWNRVLENWTNGEYWQRQDWYRPELERRFSSFQISGWFDDDFPGTRANWALAQSRAQGPQRLLIGPWKHGYNRDRQLNGMRFGVDAIRDDVALLKQKWYDHCLEGKQNDVTDVVVEYFVLGENRWRTASRWPPTEVREEPWYLHSQGRAHQFTTEGLLLHEPPERPQPADTYTYDPSDPPVNWMAFEQMASWEDVQSFPYDMRDLERRHDVAAYTSAPLAEDLTVAGDIRLVLFASTDVLDTDWWVHLSDVHPDGTSLRLSVGMLRARFRNLDDPIEHISGANFETEELLSGRLEDVVRYEILIPSIANTFRAGHRLRIAVANAWDNYSFPNSNTGMHEAFVEETVVGTMKIHHGPETPSHVVLPVLGSATAK